MAVLLETSIGDIVIDLKTNECPTACTNFLKLCKVKYYNNCLIYSVQKDYIAETGDPTNTGTGGSSIFAKLPGLTSRFFKDELSLSVKHTVKGTVAMANKKANENGSRFYITLRDQVEQLDGQHTIFGVVGEGLEVLDKINSTMVDETNAPFQNIRIWHTAVLDDPFPDPDGLEPLIPPKSPDVIPDEIFKTIDDEADESELQERMAVTLAKSQATTLEILHDIPDADITPPDNDLFIAKLNPVTQDGDLELIFSRFGPIKSCEIVRDWKTGDSLQYAFITFENVKDCEQAYFKMHDCVIDDRRIFVNFSQSVAKLWNKWRTGSRVTAEDAKEAKGKGKGRGRGRGRGDAQSKGSGKEMTQQQGDSKGPMHAAARGRARSPSGHRRGVMQRHDEKRGRHGSPARRDSRRERDRSCSRSRSRSRERRRR